jgi:hypothetical protein
VEIEVQAEQVVAVVVAAVDGVKMAIRIRTPVLGPQAVLASAFAVHTSTRFLVAVAVSSEGLVYSEGHGPVDQFRLHGALPE